MRSMCTFLMVGVLTLFGPKCSANVIWTTDQATIMEETTEATTDSYQVTLTYGSYGTLWINYNGEWGTVCDDSFDSNDHGCTVVCRQLGYGYGMHEECGAGSGRIWLDDVRCTGTEYNLNECSHSSWGVHNCWHYEDAGCKCCASEDQCPYSEGCTSEGTTEYADYPDYPDYPDYLYPDHSDWPISNVEFEVSLSNGSYGVLWINYADEWGTVCDDTFDRNDHGCTVVCRELGYGYGVHEECGSGSGRIWLDDVYCTGSESRLNQCLHQPMGSHNCEHWEDAGCKCCSSEDACGDSPGCVTNEDFPVRLTNDNYGILNVYHNGEWGTVCDDYFDSNDNGCSVVCRQLGYSTGLHVECGAGTGRIWLDDVECTGNETHLSECSRNAWEHHNCGHHEDVGCKCCNSSSQCVRSCDNGEEFPVRLTHGSYGILNVYHNGEWGTVCDDYFDSNDNGCSVVCSQLGYSTGIHVECGAGSGRIWLDDVRCTGSETHLSKCSRSAWGHHNCGHSEDAGCKCCESLSQCDQTCDIDDCSEAECGHGQCVDGLGSYTCMCDEGYTGQACDEVIEVQACVGVNCAYDCSARSNPCSPLLVPNLVYYTHVISTKFIQCVWGTCYVMPCAPGTRWSQSHLTCVHI